jgi:hypothetical protein
MNALIYFMFLAKCIYRYYVPTLFKYFKIVLFTNLITKTTVLK